MMILWTCALSEQNRIAEIEGGKCIGILHKTHKNEKSAPKPSSIVIKHRRIHFPGVPRPIILLLIFAFATGNNLFWPKAKCDDIVSRLMWCYSRLIGWTTSGNRIEFSQKDYKNKKSAPSMQKLVLGHHGNHFSRPIRRLQPLLLPTSSYDNNRFCQNRSNAL